jgi:hypothetical protein
MQTCLCMPPAGLISDVHAFPCFRHACPCMDLHAQTHLAPGGLFRNRCGLRELTSPRPGVITGTARWFELDPRVRRPFQTPRSTHATICDFMPRHRPIVLKHSRRRARRVCQTFVRPHESGSARLAIASRDSIRRGRVGGGGDPSVMQESP